MAPPAKGKGLARPPSCLTPRAGFGTLAGYRWTGGVTGSEKETGLVAAPPRRKVQFRDLREYLDLLEEAGLLKHVSGEVDLEHEIGALCTVGMEKGGPGLVFENVKGYKGKPLVSNIIYNVEQLAIAFNTAPTRMRSMRQSLMVTRTGCLQLWSRPARAKRKNFWRRHQPL